MYIHYSLACNFTRVTSPLKTLHGLPGMPLTLTEESTSTVFYHLKIPVMVDWFLLKCPVCSSRKIRPEETGLVTWRLLSVSPLPITSVKINVYTLHCSGLYERSQCKLQWKPHKTDHKYTWLGWRLKVAMFFSNYRVWSWIWAKILEVPKAARPLTR